MTVVPECDLTKFWGSEEGEGGDWRARAPLREVLGLRSVKPNLGAH